MIEREWTASAWTIIDHRLGAIGDCATKDCHRVPAYHFRPKDVGSDFCGVCAATIAGSHVGDFIEALSSSRAENARLREALEKCVEHLRCLRLGYSSLSPEEIARSALASQE